MNHRTLFAAVLTLAALAAAPVAAQDLSGSWEISTEGRRGPQTMMLELVQDGAELTGTITLTLGGRRGGGGGGGGGGTETFEITDGTTEGDHFSFDLTLTFGDNSFEQTFSGTFEGDSMEGTIEGGRGERPFTAQRGG